VIRLLATALLSIVAPGFAAAGAGEIRLPFAMGEDDLCFLNSDPDLGRVDPVLGRLGVKEGVCQGIAAISGALLRNAEFRPGTPPDARAASRLLDRAVASYLSGSETRVVIEGHANARELCRAHRDGFLRKSIYVNADLATREILLRVPELFRRKKSGVSSPSDRKLLLRRLHELRDELAGGRPALMLLWKHVVLVFAYREEPGSTVLTAYDSNSEKEREFEIEIASDGLPAAGQPMVWDVTPRRTVRLGRD
jgi:hypothetical protein